MNGADRILIAGAGPVGLSAACCLAEQGVPVLVLEAEPQLPETLRASTFHPPTLDMLERFGVLRGLLDAGGLKAPTFQYRDRNGWYVEFDFGMLADVTRHPFRVQCEQYKLNHVLYDWLGGRPQAEVRFGAKVTGVEQGDGGVSATVSGNGRSEKITGRYLIGADGGRSDVREALGIRLEGFTWPERFVTVSTPFEFENHFERLSQVSYFTDPEEWFFLLRVPGFWRAMFPTSPDETDEQVLSDATLQRRLQRVVPRREPYEIVHRVLYSVHQRVAQTYRSGRVVLAGDAAHLNNPLGGMGMNGGIHDACNLAQKLARIWRGEADDDELDRYQRQRRAIALDYVNERSIRNKKNLETCDPDERARFRSEMEAAAADPALGRDLLLKVSMIASLRQAAQTA